jgi:hypothetical protein
MFTNPGDRALQEITVSPDVLKYLDTRGGDFRICTSCGGPILLPVHIKPPKKNDLLLRSGSHTIYVSIHQARFLQTISADMIPFYGDADICRGIHDDF